MAKASQAKGLKGEREVRALWESHGFTVRGLEGEGDHLIIRPVWRQTLRGRPPIHSEVKRAENVRFWKWVAQAKRDAPPNAVPIVTTRRNGAEWYSIIRTDDLARLLA